MRRVFWLALAGSMLIVACGSGSAKPGSAESNWAAQHGPTVEALRTELTFARSDLDKGQQQDILAACNLLHDDLAAVSATLPAPDPTVNSDLHGALAILTSGVTDCLQGARLASVASLNERAMAELSAASSRLDTASQAIAARK
jgi:hypothetical protein